MDYVVHINDGSREIRPIVLRLLPGEETIFNLKVVNHGEPSNISLEASDPLIKAVRLKRPDHYVVMEENIPVMARMPERVSHLEGELLLTSSAGESVVPISLVRESEGFGDDRDPGEIQMLADGDPSNDIEDREAENKEGEDREAEGREGDEDDGDGDGAGEGEASRLDGSHEDAERIRFSRQKDLQSYRAASRSRSTAGFGDSREHQEHQGESSYGNYGNKTGSENGSERGNEQRHEQSYGQSYERSYGQGYDQGYDRNHDQVPHISSEDSSPEDECSEDNTKEGLVDRLLTMKLNRESIQPVPTIILLSLIVALVLTFYTKSIPVYPGALASSILIVTLIIYGAATLLKA